MCQVNRRAALLIQHASLQHIMVSHSLKQPLFLTAFNQRISPLYPLFSRWSSPRLKVAHYKIQGPQVPTCSCFKHVHSLADLGCKKNGISSFQRDPKTKNVKKCPSIQIKIFKTIPPPKKHYFTSSDPHHDMLGGGCQVRGCHWEYDGKNGRIWEHWFQVSLA